MSIPSADYEKSVFVNCPFDADYEPVLQAILFCVVDCGLKPRIASERLDSGEVRLQKIVELMRGSRFSIHDLSRVRSSAANELARLNMPFELGVSYGISVGAHGPTTSQRLLVMAEDEYVYQAALSDISGWDVRAHGDSFERAMKHVRAWLRSHGVGDRSNSQIIGRYYGYQEWDFERLIDHGWSEDDIGERETGELLEAMMIWRDAGGPVSYS